MQPENTGNMYTILKSTTKAHHLPLHLLNSIWETVLTFSWVIFWYIILGFLQYFPEFFFRRRLPFLSFFVQVISVIFRSGLMTANVYQQCFSPNMISLALALCLESFWCWKINPFPIRHFPEGMAWWDSSPHILYSSTSHTWEEKLERGGAMRWLHFCQWCWGYCPNHGIMNAEKYSQVLIHYAHSFWKASDWERSWGFSVSQWSQAHC